MITAENKLFVIRNFIRKNDSHLNSTLLLSCILQVLSYVLTNFIFSRLVNDGFVFWWSWHHRSHRVIGCFYKLLYLFLLIFYLFLDFGYFGEIQLKIEWGPLEDSSENRSFPLQRDNLSTILTQVSPIKNDSVQTLDITLKFT